MKNKEEVEKKLRENLLLLAEGDKEKAAKIWEAQKGSDLDALIWRTRVFKDLGYCFRCGTSLKDEFTVETNGIPHCLMPCAV